MTLRILRENQEGGDNINIAERIAIRGYSAISAGSMKGLLQKLHRARHA